MIKKKENRSLFIGPFQPELEEAFFDFVKRKKEPDPLRPVVVLVGSNLLGLYLRRLFTLKGLDHINIHFLTFLDLAKALAAEPLSEERIRPLPRFGDLVCITALARQVEAHSYFQPIADRKGFQRALRATFQDLWDAGIEELPVKGKEKKLLELGDLYRDYRSLIGKDFYNDSELIFRACKEVQGFLRTFGCEELIIYGFYDFTEGQKRLIEACAGHLDVTAFLPWRESQGFAYALPTLQWYQGLGLAVKALWGPERGEEKSLPLLQQQLFRDEPGGPPAPDARMVLLISAPGEAQEVQEIAREILRLAREEEVSFHEIGILLRNAELYGPLIQEAFLNLGIPIYFQGGTPLARSQSGKSALLLLDLVSSNLPRAEVMEFLTFAPIAWSRFFKEEPSPSQWDSISREAGIVEGRRQWEEKLAGLMAHGEKSGPEEDRRKGKFLGEAAESFWRFLKDFFEALERFPKKGTWKGMANATISLMEVYFEEGEREEAIFQAVRELESLDALGGQIDVPQFKEVLSEALEEKALRQGFFQKGGVCVSDLMPARGLSFRAVFIPGLVERAFPAAARQDPLLLDHEREEVNRSFGRRGGMPLKRSRFQEERLLFSLAVGSAREKLILSYPRLDANSGRERIPSFFLLRVGEALQGESVDYSRLETLPTYRRVPLSRLAPEDPGQAIDEGEYDLGQVRRSLGGGGRGEVAYLKHLFPNFDRAERLGRLRWGKKTFTEYDGCLKSAQARRLLRERFAISGQVLSPTELETYASCPYRYFLSQVLQLKVLPFPEEIRRIQPLDRGMVIHEILSFFFERVQKEFPGPWQPEKIEAYWQMMLEVASRVFHEAEDRGLTGFPLLWELDRQALLEDLRAFLKIETEEGRNVIPVDFEIRFGYKRPDVQKGGRREAASLALDDGTTISFRGRIDRVDMSLKNDSLRVIDYKTGKIQGKEDSFCGGTTLQLPLYLLAACQIWSQANIEKSWAEYYSVSREQKFKRLFFRGENWGEKEKVLKKIIETIARGISEGTFFPYGGDEKECGGCDFDRLCEHGVESLFQKKKNDPRARTFLQMREIP